MRLLVTGSAGMLGHRVVAVAQERGHEVTGIDVDDADITNSLDIGTRITDARPDVVINCAAYTNVDAAEEDEETALMVNGVGAGYVAEAAADADARVVHVSTDYVFNGENDKPWLESDPTFPLGAYGRTKLAGEHAVVAATNNYAIARTAWLFGAGGPNFCDTMLQLATEHRSVSVVTDQRGCPTWTGHLAPALVDLAEADTAGLFHTAGAGSCSWFELTRELYARAGIDCDVQPTTTAEFPRHAPRPAWSVMDSERADGPRLPAWQEGVAGHLSETIGA